MDGVEDRRRRSVTVSRRGFLETTGAVAGAFAAAPLLQGVRAPRTADRAEDVILRNPLVYDGTGTPPMQTDVAVAGDRIAAVGPRLPRARAREVNQAGLALAPGFIDIHSHTDFELLIDPSAPSKIRQGVTTEVAGQDGGSIGPWRAARAAEVRDTYRERYGVAIDFDDLPGFFRRLERSRTAVNFASMVGHGTIRGFVVGEAARPATDTEIAAMQDHVRRAIAAGACGFSSGLEYHPGAFADLAELVALASVLRGTGLPYATHMRSEDDHLFAAIEEALNVGRAAGVPVHISHLKAEGKRNWWKADPVLETLEAARAGGIDVSYDRYPYVAYATGLGFLFPVWAQDGGTDAFLLRLVDPMTAPKLKAAVLDKIARLGSWDAVLISSTGADSLAWARGRRLGALAAERGQDPYDLLVQLTKADRNRAGMVGFGMSEANTAKFLAHPLGMVCSDGSALATEGPLAAGAPHPRNFGTFPRVLGHYCRDHKLLPLETAIHKMSGMPAARLRLERRGVVRPGAFADLVVFDPAAVRDLATFDHPQQYPEGIPHVMVNGSFALWDGDRTDALPGRIVRPGG